MSPSRDRPKRQPQRWLIPLLIGIALAVIAFVAVVLAVTGQSLF